ncbi:hypothetical protein VCUG_02613 [Vavraia culicis subsp. floridensis]|uniref:Uncharacterized protein n=1 Tax=Vavraia culicis (isolate floridensis) TaxID=948595 RepID=L2GRK7_VAVCU|nr:uncharacterized protein VCUG_02613 [Vavraia culicis subsp. floridensis]ELA45898.1 hypothetical protein VCUG_02613 [Vavraia culicis subsp. floridensis]
MHQIMVRLTFSCVIKMMHCSDSDGTLQNCARNMADLINPVDVDNPDDSKATSTCLQRNESQNIYHGSISYLQHYKQTHGYMFQGINNDRPSTSKLFKVIDFIWNQHELSKLENIRRMLLHCDDSAINNHFVELKAVLMKFIAMTLESRKRLSQVKKRKNESKNIVDAISEHMKETYHNTIKG